MESIISIYLIIYGHFLSKVPQWVISQQEMPYPAYYRYHTVYYMYVVCIPCILQVSQVNNILDTLPVTPYSFRFIILKY